MAANDLAIRVRNVSHQFGDEGSTQFVRAMLETSLDIHRGELLNDALSALASDCLIAAILSALNPFERPN